MEKILNHPSYDIVQHRQEDCPAVYVRSNRDNNNAKHRQEHGHAVYVGNEEKVK